MAQYEITLVEPNNFSTVVMEGGDVVETLVTYFEEHDEPTRAEMREQIMGRMKTRTEGWMFVNDDDRYIIKKLS